MRSVNSTYITEDLLSLGHPAQLRTVAVRVEQGLLYIPVLSVTFLNKVGSQDLLHVHSIQNTVNLMYFSIKEETEVPTLL